MAVALVNLGSVAASLAPSFPAATAAHHLLVAWMFANDSGASDPFSTTASGWLKADTGGGAFEWSSLWYKPDCAAGETAPAFTVAGGSVFRSLLGEFSGVATTSPLDSHGNNFGGNSTQTATNAAADTASGDLIIYLAGWNGGSGTTTITLTMADGTAASVTPNETKDFTTSGFYYDFAWGVAGSSGANPDTATGTLGLFSGGSCAIASFKPDPGTSTSPAYAGAATALAGGTGSWVNTANADGAPNSTYATWTAP